MVTTSWLLILEPVGVTFQLKQNKHDSTL